MISMGLYKPLRYVRMRKTYRSKPSSFSHYLLIQAFDGPDQTLVLSGSSAPGNHAAFISVWKMRPTEKRLRFTWVDILVTAQVAIFLAVAIVCIQAYFMRVSFITYTDLENWLMRGEESQQSGFHSYCIH